MLDHDRYPVDAECELEEELDLPDRLLHVYDSTSGELRCDADDERHLRAEVDAFLETGRDRLIALTSHTGADVTIVASKIVNWVVSTRASRLMSRTISRRLDAAQKRRDLLDGGDT